MQLLNLPNEVLERVARYLDTESVASFALSHERLRAVSYNVTTTVETSKISTVLWQYLTVNGSSVTTLDVSGCSQYPCNMLQLITACPNVRRLNTVNSAFPYHEVLGVIQLLPRLETLSFSLLVFHPMPFPGSIRLKNLRSLYVEITPSFEAFNFVVDMLNSSDVIQKVHINLIGRPASPHHVSTTPRWVAAERWQTLSTVVCSRNLSNIGTEMHVALLEQIFAAKMNGKIYSWLHDDKDCYVYESGNLNCTSDVVVNADKVDLLKHFQQVTVCREQRAQPQPQPEQEVTYPWGRPRGMCLRAPAWEPSLAANSIHRHLSGSLVELDLSFCHSNYSQRDRLNIIAALPSLETLAVTLCFLLGPRRISLFGRKPEATASHILLKALQKLKLKRLIIRGNNLREMSARHGSCLRCCDTVTRDNIVQAEFLSDLEELTLANVTVHESAFENFANPNVRTLRLCLNEGSSLTGLRSVIQRCPRLENFKLDMPNLPLNSVAVWEAVAQAEKLRQLCLGTCRGSLDMDPKSKDAIEQHVTRLTATLDAMHVHTDSSNNDYLHKILYDPVTCRSRAAPESQTAFLHSTHPNLTLIRSATLSQHIVGRGLCCIESFVGMVPPTGWTVD